MVTLYEYRRLNFPRLSEMIVATGMLCNLSAVTLVSPPYAHLSCRSRMTAATAEQQNGEWYCHRGPTNSTLPQWVLYGGVTCHGAG